MVQIARAYNVGFVELRAANPYLDPWIPGEGKKIIIPSMHLLPRAPHTGLVVNLAEMRLYAFLKPGQVKTFPLGIGAEGLSTPSGTTTIVRKVVGPTWRPTPRMHKIHPELPPVVGPGPDNPMGTNAMYLGWPQYAIHGTDKPFSIGRRASSGCMRMYPENITELYAMTPVGTTVTVVNQPIMLAWVGDRLYMEAHPTTDQADKMEIDGGLPGYVFTEEDMGAIVAAAGDSARNLNWPLIRQVVRERRGYPVEIYRKGGTAPAVKAETVAVDAEDKPLVNDSPKSKPEPKASGDERALEKQVKTSPDKTETKEKAEPKAAHKATEEKAEGSSPHDLNDDSEEVVIEKQVKHKVKAKKPAVVEKDDDAEEPRPVRKVVITTPN
ncbi:MAG: ErfK/YbiS/YcfS/YnhG like protein [Micavibrio sp.]|nr:ErfK/YbiS/YcfS/YnhG like protein [Micavibrio sp.]